MYLLRCGWSSFVSSFFNAVFFSFTGIHVQYNDADSQI